jgi:hypothetical protein
MIAALEPFVDNANSAATRSSRFIDEVHAMPLGTRSLQAGE